MKRDPQGNWRSIKIIRRRGLCQGRVAVQIEMPAQDWAWIEELEDRLMIPDHDLLYMGFFQGMERVGWKNPDHVTTPSEPPPRTYALRNNAPTAEEIEAASNIIPFPTQSDPSELDDDVPF